MTEKFIRYIQYEKRYSSHTVLSYSSDLANFNAFLQENYPEKTPETTDRQIIRSWILTLTESGISPRSVNRKIAVLRSFFKFLLREKVVASNPLQAIQPLKVQKKLPRFIEEDKMNVLLDQCDFGDDFSGIRNRLLIEMLYGTGMRRDELINLKNEALNLTENTLKLHGKGNKERIVPINQTLQALIELYNNKKSEITDLPDHDYVMITDKGQKLYPMFVYRTVKKYLHLVTTADKRSPHILRHSFATHLLNKGADLNAVKDLLGHASLAATQVYTHNTTDKLKKIFERAHPKA